MADRKRAVKQRRRERKNVPQGHVHIQASFNNTIVTITDQTGNVVSRAVGVPGLRPCDVVQAGQQIATRQAGQRIVTGQVGQQTVTGQAGQRIVARHGGECATRRLPARLGVPQTVKPGRHAPPPAPTPPRRHAARSGAACKIV